MLLRNPFFPLLIVTLLRLWSACSSSSFHCAVSLAWKRGPTALLYNTSSPRLPGWPMHLGETLVLSLRDALRCSTSKSIRWRHRKSYALRANSFGRTYKNQNFFLVHEWRVSVENHLIILRLLRAFSMRRSTTKSGTGKDYLSRLRSSTMSTIKCLIKDSPLWCGVMSTNLKNPED